MPNRFEILVRDFVDDVERYCTRPGNWHERKAYRAYVMQTCYELARGGTSLDEVTVEPLRATLAVVAPTIQPRMSPIGLEQHTAMAYVYLNLAWKNFADVCIAELAKRATSWTTTIDIGGQTIALADWVDDKHYTTVELKGIKPKPPTHGTRRRGK